MAIYPPEDPKEMARINKEIEEELTQELEGKTIKKKKLTKVKRRTDKIFYLQMGILLIVLLLYKTLPLFITAFGQK